jgi:hypothetical protein
VRSIDRCRVRNPPGFCEAGIPEDFAALLAQGLRAGPPLRREQGVEAAAEIGIHPFFQGLALDELGPADLNHALAVPQGFQSHEPPLALLLIAVKLRFAKTRGSGGQSLNAKGAIHGVLPVGFTAFSQLKSRQFSGGLGVGRVGNSITG